MLLNPFSHSFLLLKSIPHNATLKNTNTILNFGEKSATEQQRIILQWFINSPFLYLLLPYLLTAYIYLFGLLQFSIKTLLLSRPLLPNECKVHISKRATAKPGEASKNYSPFAIKLLLSTFKCYFVVKACNIRSTFLTANNNNHIAIRDCSAKLSHKMT